MKHHATAPGSLTPKRPPALAAGTPWLPALAFALPFALPLIAGCSGSLLPKPQAPVARFALEVRAAATAAPAAAAGAPVIIVEVPRAAPGYDSRHMVYQRRALQLEAFAFHEWVEPPVDMIAPMLARALQDSGRFGMVLLAPTAAAVAGGVRLQTEQLRLLQDFTQTPSHVRLSLRALLLDSATRQAIAWREFEVSVPTASEDPVAGAASAQAAAQRLLAEVAAFCSEHVRASPLKL